MTRELVLTADDFGLDAGVNAAVAELAHLGALTATSLLTTRPDAEAALALEVPIAVGLHVELDPALLAHAGPEEIEGWIEEQLAWLTARGPAPTHLDLHTSALYGLGPEASAGAPTGVVPQAITVAARHGLSLRLPRYLPPLDAPAGFRGHHADAVARADAAGVRIPEIMLGDPRPPDTIRDRADLLGMYVGLLPAVPDGVSEMFLHPAVPGVGGTDEPAAMRRKRTWEYELLRSGDLRAAIEDHGIALTHW